MVQSFVCHRCLKIDENRGLDGSKIVQNRGLEGLGAALGWLGVSLAKFGSDFFRKTSPGYAQDGLSERQVGAGAAHVGPCWR